MRQDYFDRVYEKTYVSLLRYAVVHLSDPLDAENRDRVVSIFLDLAHSKGRTVLVVTHDSSVAERCDRVIRMKDGVITP